MTRGKEALTGWLLILPAIFLLAAFTHYPVVMTVISSFYDPGSFFRPARFLGIENYKQMLQDPVFMRSAFNNLVYVVMTVLPSIALAIIMALWVNAGSRKKGFLRLAFFTPTILPMIAAANIWLFFYTPEIGIFNRVRGVFGLSAINWLGNTSTALPSIIVLTIWKEAGFFMIFYLAGLKSISRSLYEAAFMEGAGRIRVFFRITFPLLMPVTLFVLVNATINAFKKVDHLFVLTKGGPNNATSLLLYYVYETAFSFFDVSYSSSITTVILVFLACLSLAKIRYFDKRIHYQ